MIRIRNQPTTLTMSVPVDLVIETDRETVFVQWTVYTLAHNLDSGKGSVVSVAPTTPVVHYVHVRAVFSDGSEEESVFTFSVSARRSTSPRLDVTWGQVIYAEGDDISARIGFSDPDGMPYQSISWTLYKNGVRAVDGTSTAVSYADAGIGLYRVDVSVVDGTGATVSASDTTFVGEGAEVAYSLTPPQPTDTVQLLGDVYSHDMHSDGGTVTSLPYALGALTETIVLLPGTTHFKPELELLPPKGLLDDEVVVRTSLGNWTLVGPPSGLDGEDVGYCYTHGRPLVPAPEDLVLRATIEAYNVRGSTSVGYDFRVKFRCYRSMGRVMYSYSKCDYSTVLGGTGKRETKVAAIFTGIQVELDDSKDALEVDSPENFTTPNVQVIPARLAITGAPDPTTTASNLYFTDANILAVYEPESETLPNLTAHGAYGLLGGRAFYLSLDQPGNPPTINRIKRLTGKMVVYIAAGAVDGDAAILADIVTSLPYSHADGSVQESYPVRVPVPNPVYSPDEDLYVKVGEVDIDLADYQFSRGGLLVYFSLEDILFMNPTSFGQLYQNAGRPAAGWISVNSVLETDDSLTITSASGANAYSIPTDVVLMSTTALQAQAIAKAIMADPDGMDTVHHRQTPNPDVYAFAVGNRVIVISRRPGTAGNSIAIAVDAANLTCSANLSGGVGWATPATSITGATDVVVANAGTRVQFPNLPVSNRLLVSTPKSNVGAMYVGDVTVTGSNGNSRQLIMTPDSREYLYVSNANLLYGNADVNGDRITVLSES